MDLSRTKFVDWLTALFGAALIGLLWAHWYRSAALPAGATARVGTGWTAYAPIPHVAAFNAWQSFAVNDVILFIAGLLGIWVLVATLVMDTPAIPITAATFATIAGLLASILTVIRVIWPPDLGPGPTARAGGAWLGMDAAIGLFVCALFAARDERRAAPGTAQVPITELPAPRVTGEGSGA